MRTLKLSIFVIVSLTISNWTPVQASGTDVHRTIVVAEGEKFITLDEHEGRGGWKLTRQDQSWASHSYGAMWATHGAVLGGPAAREGAVATQAVTVNDAGAYRVWSKYQSMPYFTYEHKVEILQAGKILFSHIYGKRNAPRFFSFAGAYQSPPIGECWWPWGVDHDAAEAPATLVKLQAGSATIRLTTVRGGPDQEDAMVDFILLTTNVEDDYKGYRPYQAGSPFTYEALSATPLYVRFLNPTDADAALHLRKPIGHYQPVYGGWGKDLPLTAPGAWSEWYNIGQDLNLLHDEGLRCAVLDATDIQLQFALDEAGETIVGDVTVINNEAVIIPMEITWDRGSVIKTNRQHAAEIVASGRNEWRTANGGKKPQWLAYFGGFGGFRGKDDYPWMEVLKDALGYNTGLSDKYEHLEIDGYFCHAMGEEKIKAVADGSPDPSKHRVLSFGDEISLGNIDFDSEELQAKFTAWLTVKGYTEEDLGVPVAQAKLVGEGDPRPAWYSNLFNEEERFADFRSNTEYAERLFGKQVRTGANYSPHHLALCYGPVFQWVDLFKHRGMSMFWSEDYIFSVPEPPQILSWMMAQARCGVKYHDLPIHMYIMPHAPGQLPEVLRRNMVFAIGAGAEQIDSFLVGAMEQCTENFVSWGRREQFRAIHESIYDSAEAEAYRIDAKMRPSRVALVLSKATDYNESRTFVDSKLDPFVSRADNSPETINQIICRKDQQMLYLALRHAQHGVELITEDDIVDLGLLRNYDVVYFAGEWIDHRIIPLLSDWVTAGGVLYATAGIGHLNEFKEPATDMLKLLGLKDVTTEKSLYIIRTLLELPLAEAIGTIDMSGFQIPAIGMRQRLTLDGAAVIGKWQDGSAAVTMHALGRGKAFAVGTLAGNTYMKSALRRRPFARGGARTAYNPTDFGAAETLLVQLGILGLKRDVSCNNPQVEANVYDGPSGTLVTLVNWTNDARISNLSLTLNLPFEPASARSVEQQANVDVKYADGVATITTDLTEADYILLPKKQ